jgi:hypothetical protein
MLIRKILGATALYQPPASWDEKAQEVRCIPIYAREDTSAGTIAVAWEPTPEELAALNAGASVVLTMWGGLAPHSLTVEPQE